MRPDPALVLLAVLAAAPALAQDVLQPTPIEPPPQTRPQTRPPTGVLQPAPTPHPPADLPPEETLPPPDAPPPPPPERPLTTAPPPLIWQKRGAALLQVLDKLTGQKTILTVPTGTPSRWRDLGITVRSCFARPPDQPPDATAFLIIQDIGQTAPRFSGWMLAAEPAASMLEHPVYDVRVLACA